MVLAAGQELSNIFDIRLQGGLGGNGGRGGHRGEAGVKVYHTKDGRTFEKRGSAGRRGIDGKIGENGNNGSLLMLELNISKMFNGCLDIRQLLD